jgi:hypothetical protein
MTRYSVVTPRKKIYQVCISETDTARARCPEPSSDFLTASPPGEKTTARKDQARQSRTCNWTRDGIEDDVVHIGRARGRDIEKNPKGRKRVGDEAVGKGIDDCVKPERAGRTTHHDPKHTAKWRRCPLYLEFIIHISIVSRQIDRMEFERYAIVSSHIQLSNC